MNFKHKHIKDMKNINKGKEDGWDALRKKKKSHKQSISNKKETRCAISSIVRMCAYSGIDMQYNCYIVMFRIGEP
jgi:hypothetical protein